MKTSGTTLAATALLALIAATAAQAASATGETGPLPWSARWQELSAAQQEIVRSRYDALGADDEPPYPVDGIGTLMRPLLDSARQIRMDGWVDAIADVDSTGKVRSVSVYQSPDKVIITPLVTSLLMEQHFKPARCKGGPCAMPFALRVDLAAH